MRAILEPRHQKPNRLSLRVIVALTLVLSSFAASAQIFPPPSTSYGIRPNRGAFDSALYMPTGCGVPTDSTFLFSQGFGHGQQLALGAFYSDICGHHVYAWDPSLKSWHRIDSSGGFGGSDSGFQVLYAPLSGVPIAKYVDGSGHRFVLYDTTGSHPGAIGTNAGIQKKIDSLSGVIGGLLAAKFGLTDTGYTKTLASVYTLRKVSDSLAAAYTAGLGTKYGAADTGYTHTLATVFTLAKVRDSLSALILLRRLISDTSGTNSTATRGYVGKVRDSLATLIGSGGGSTLTFGTGLQTGSYNGSAPKTVNVDTIAMATRNALDSAMAHGFNYSFRAKGQPGDTSYITGTDSTFHVAAQRDSLDYHSVINPDSSRTHYVNAHDSATMQSKAQTDSMRTHVYTALGLRVQSTKRSGDSVYNCYGASGTNCVFAYFDSLGGGSSTTIPYYWATKYGLSTSMSGTATDVAPFIQAAVDSAHAHGGGIVVVPPGYYAFSTVDITGMPDVGIKGDGKVNTFFSETTVGDTMIKSNNNQFYTNPGTNTGNAPGYGMSPLSGFTLEGHNKAVIGANVQYGYWLHWYDIGIDSCTAVGLNLKGTLTSGFEDMLIKWCPTGVFADTINLTPGGVVAPNLLDFERIRVYNCTTWGFDVRNCGGAFTINGFDITDEGTNHNPLTGGVHFVNLGATSGFSLSNGWFEHNVGSLIRVESTAAHPTLNISQITVANTLTPSYGLYLNPSYANTIVNVSGSPMTGDSVDIYTNGNTQVNEIGSSFTTTNQPSAARYLYEHTYGTAYATAFPIGSSGAPFISSYGTGAGTSPSASVSAASTNQGIALTITIGSGAAANSPIVTIGYDIAWVTTGIVPQVTPGNYMANSLAGGSLPTASGTGTYNYILLTSGDNALLPGTYVFFISNRGK